MIRLILLILPDGQFQARLLLSTAITCIKNGKCVAKVENFSEKCEKARYSIANSFHPRWDIIGSIIKKKGDIKYAFFPIPEHNYLGFDDIPTNLSMFFPKNLKHGND